MEITHGSEFFFFFFEVGKMKDEIFGFGWS